MEFMSHLNSSRHMIKFTSEYSGTALKFLDISINVGAAGSWGQIFFASLLLQISTCIRNRVTQGIPKKPFNLARHLGYAESALMTSVFLTGWESL